jgi:ornithine cyclodeaminase/alanine dehydrogenase-like protein (mu-crystallin family)
LIGTKAGRSSESEITLFKSLGLAIEDVACADYIYKKATAKNIGTWINWSSL